MALPSYATTGQKVGYYSFLTYCGLVFFFLIAPIFIILPLSFSASPFFEFTREFMNFEPEAWSLRWYRQMVGISSIGDTTVVTNKWMLGTRNSFFIGICATFLATALGTVAALGLSRPHMPFKAVLMAILISPMIVPLIITAAGMFFFFAKVNLVATLPGLIIAHTILGIPFVVITVTASLAGFDNNLLRAGATLGGSPLRNFLKIQAPLIAPGVISGALFAFITSFDEVVIVLFVGGPEQYTLPRQMWSGIRNEISPTILAAATILVIFSILLLTTLEMLRRRAEKIRGITPH